MLGYILLTLLAALVLLLAVLVVRTLRFRPLAEPPVEDMPVEVDGDRAAESLAAMVRCKTVSSRDRSMVDDKEFDRFRQLLIDRYPNITKTCTLERVGDTGLLYLWKGSSSDEPAVLMSHYDVVPADEAAWDKPAFEGIIEDGVLWGRGTLDTKGTLCGVMEAAEKLIGDGFRPQNDIYFSFAGDEEIAGTGAPGIVDLLESRGIVPALVVDEGGAVVEDVFPGVKGSCALIGTGEKGMLDLEFSVKSTGGHASAPPPHTLVGRLAQAVVAVENNPMPAFLCPPVAGMFDTLGRRSSFVYRMIFANLWLFRPVLDAICKKSGGELNAMLRTTCAFTMMQASNASNVLPPEASVTANLRLMAPDTVEGVVERIRGTVGDDIALRVIHGQNPSPYSTTDCAGYEKLKKAIAATWKGAVVSPYLMMAASDSRHFCRISDKVMRFSAMALSKEERGLIHAHNERIPVDKIATTVAFYQRLMLQL